MSIPSWSAAYDPRVPTAAVSQLAAMRRYYQLYFGGVGEAIRGCWSAGGEGSHAEDIGDRRGADGIDRKPTSGVQRQATRD